MKENKNDIIKKITEITKRDIDLSTHSEAELLELEKNILNFREKWYLVDDLGQRVETWKFEKLTNEYSLAFDITNPLTIIENGTLLEIEKQDRTQHWMQRYLMNNKIYHVFVNFMDYHWIGLENLGYEKYMGNVVTRQIIEIDREINDTCKQLCVLLNEIKKLTDNPEVHSLLTRTKDLLVIFHITNKL